MRRQQSVNASATSPPSEPCRLALACSVKRSDVKPPCQGLDDPRSNDCYGHGSLYKLWHYLKPYHPDMLGGTSTLSNKWFMVYFTVLAWAVVAAVGLGSELTMGCAPRRIERVRSFAALVTVAWAQHRAHVSPVGSSTRRHSPMLCIYYSPLAQVPFPAGTR